MKKLTLWVLLFSLILMGIAYAADVSATATTNYLDTFYKVAIAALMSVVSALLATLIPIILRKGNDISDAFWNYLKNLAKKIENERIQARLVAFFDTLDTATDKVLAIAGKVKITRNSEGKIVVENLEELKNEIKTNVAPEVTQSTKDLAQNLGVDAEKYIEEQVKLKAQALL